MFAGTPTLVYAFGSLGMVVIIESYNSILSLLHHEQGIP